MKIGVVGYSAAKYDEDKARLLVRVGLSYLVNYFKDVDNSPVEIVSGLTNLGIPALAYDYAKTNGIFTVGIACKKAFDYERFPVDKTFIMGKDWGEESETFLRYIDCLLRVGGGKQSREETEAFRKMKPDALIIELELEETKQ